MTKEEFLQIKEMSEDEKLALIVELTGELGRTKSELRRLEMRSVFDEPDDMTGAY